MRSCRLVDALFLCLAVGVALVPSVGHLLLAAPVLTGVAGRAVLRHRRRVPSAGRHVARRHVWIAQRVGT